MSVLPYTQAQIRAVPPSWAKLNHSKTYCYFIQDKLLTNIHNSTSHLQTIITVTNFLHHQTHAGSHQPYTPVAVSPHQRSHTHQQTPELIFHSRTEHHPTWQHYFQLLHCIIYYTHYMQVNQITLSRASTTAPFSSRSLTMLTSPHPWLAPIRGVKPSAFYKGHITSQVKRCNPATNETWKVKFGLHHFAG